MIRKQGDKYVLYTQDGTRILGTHHTKNQAMLQWVEEISKKRANETKAKTDRGLND